MARTLELVAAAGVAAILTIVYLVFVGRTLGPSEYADFATALSIVHFFAVALSPVAPALARIVARRIARGQDEEATALRNAVVKRLAVACAAGTIILSAISPLVTRWLNFRSALPVIVASIAALLFALVSADRGVLQGRMRFRSYNFNIIIEAVLRTGGALLLLRLFPRTATTALVSYVLALVVAEAMMAAVSRPARTEATVDWAELRTLTVPIFLLMIAAAAMQNLDMLAVKRWMSQEDAGRYGAAVAVARAFAVVFVPIYVLAGPVLSTAHERNEPVVRPAVRLMFLYLGLCAPGIAVLMLWPERVIQLSFGPDFAGGSFAVALLGWVVILVHASLLLTQVLITLEDFRFLRIYAVALAAEVAGLLVFHDTIEQIVTVACVVQVLLVMAMSVLVVRVRS